MSAAESRTSKKRQRSEPSALAETTVPVDNINEGSDDGEDRADEEDGHDFEGDEDDDFGDDDQNEEDKDDEGDDVAESSQAALKKAKTSGTSSAERRGKDKDRSQGKSKSKSKRKAPTPGIVYISRLPPGMTPQKVRHLMARWGEVGKVYAQRRDGYNPNSAAAKKQKQKHRQADFTEAWVEFLDKAMAKTVAQMLNAQVIGGKKGDRWRDDIWTMRYLSGFKWEMLGEQVAYEKQAHQARLRNEITQSKSAQDQYLRNVELARVLAKRQQKKVDAGGDAAAATTPGSASAGSQAKAVKGAAGQGQDEEGRKSGYRQREAVDRSKAGQGAGMDAVLSSIF